MSIREKIRSKTLGADKHFRSEIVKWDDIEVELRQPSNKARRNLLQKAKDESGNIDPLEFLVWATIEGTFVPGTNEKVFDDGDYDALMEQPVGSFLDVFGEKAVEVFTPGGKPKK